MKGANTKIYIQPLLNLNIKGGVYPMIGSRPRSNLNSLITDLFNKLIPYAQASLLFSNNSRTTVGSYKIVHELNFVHLKGLLETLA